MHELHIDKRVTVSEMYFPVDGYRFDAQIWSSSDFGRSWWYWGRGKFVTTLDEAEDYAVSELSEEGAYEIVKYAISSKNASRGEQREIHYERFTSKEKAQEYCDAINKVQPSREAVVVERKW